MIPMFCYFGAAALLVLKMMKFIQIIILLCYLSFSSSLYPRCAWQGSFEDFQILQHLTSSTLLLLFALTYDMNAKGVFLPTSPAIEQPNSLFRISASCISLEQ